ncbi:unnamed protein product [Protopolystoma xenopodis]|uniref:Uncharacterized protein n=1 Tax=Protopolystoma xenopodis TaxID=117903 RepID=A0A3S5C4Y2_9PLAT|nr:unnamed protein product [Protopolystoma xenopodis]
MHHRSQGALERSVCRRVVEACDTECEWPIPVGSGLVLADESRRSRDDDAAVVRCCDKPQLSGGKVFCSTSASTAGPTQRLADCSPAGYVHVELEAAFARCSKVAGWPALDAKVFTIPTAGRAESAGPCWAGSVDKRASSVPSAEVVAAPL